MSVDREQLVKILTSLHEEMKYLILKSGISEEKYSSILQVIEEDSESIASVYVWLKEIRYAEYDDVLKVHERHTPETWKMYEIMEVFNLAEQKLLNTRLKKLRIAINRSNHVAKSKSEGSTKGGGEVHFRPSETRTDEGGGGGR